MDMIGDPEEDSFSRQMYFPTMVFQINCSDHKALNSYLLDLIYKEREKDERGIVRSSFKSLGGWHSHNSLHKESAYKPLTDRIDLAAKRISKKLGYAKNKSLRTTTMWSIINPPGGANKAHIHPSSMWSGVYYVQAPDDAGDIEFTDPRTAHLMNQPKFEDGEKRNKENWTKVNHNPTPGKMLFFPSWLYHAVNPNMTELTGDDGNRVIISFNLSQITPFSKGPFPKLKVRKRKE